MNSCIQSWHTIDQLYVILTACWFCMEVQESAGYSNGDDKVRLMGCYHVLQCTVFKGSLEVGSARLNRHGSFPSG